MIHPIGCGQLTPIKLFEYKNGIVSLPAARRRSVICYENCK